MNSHWRTIPGFIQVGILGTTHGATGEMKFHVDDRYFDECLEVQFLFVEIEGDKVPFEVEGFRATQDLLVKFQRVGDPSDAADLIGCRVYLPSDELGKKRQREASGLNYINLDGMHLIDEEAGDLGIIKEIRAFPEQEMAVITYRGNEVLVPLNDTFIQKVDEAARSVYVSLPKGLLDL